MLIVRIVFMLIHVKQAHLSNAVLDLKDIIALDRLDKGTTIQSKTHTHQ